MSGSDGGQGQAPGLAGLEIRAEGLCKRPEQGCQTVPSSAHHVMVAGCAACLCGAGLLFVALTVVFLLLLS